MYKRLRIYYLYTALPFALLLLGATLYHDAIVKTIKSNPHPQINFIIFAIILVGGVLILRIIHRLMQEAQQLSIFTKAQKSGISAEELQNIALNSDADISYVLRMIASSTGRTIRHQEQVAIENETLKFRERLMSRNALPQFFSGLLVGMGLLGTFIGLLATLDDIASLIASFGNLDLKTADPITIFAQLVKRMEAPMHSMGIAFSASMYGLMGSIILSFMMVSVRRCMNEITSLAGSEVAQHIEYSFGRGVDSKTEQAASILTLPAGTRPLNPSEILNIQRAQTPAKEEVLEAVVNAQQEILAHRKEEDEASGLLSEFSGEMASGFSLGSSSTTEEIRTLRRIEERLAESLRLQERSLTTEIDDFQKQRADALRVIAEQTAASNDFKAELQRLGRQMSDLLTIAERNSVNIGGNVSELKILHRDGALENQRLLTAMLQLQTELLETMRHNRAQQ